MFETIQEIYMAVKEFYSKTNKRPNVIFINYSNKCSFIEMLWKESQYTSSTIFHSCDYGFDNLEIFGLKVKFTNTIEGVDYLKEFEYIERPKPQICKNKVIKNKKRKIIL